MNKFKPILGPDLEKRKKRLLKILVNLNKGRTDAINLGGGFKFYAKYYI